MSRSMVRFLTAFGMVMFLAVDGIVTFWREVNHPGTDQLSAVQLTQIYVQDGFFALVVIGIGIAVYIGSRGDD